MQIVKKSQRKEFKNSEYCIAFEYPINDKDINGAIIKLNGRYPDPGFAINEICKEMAYVVEGNGKIVIEEKEYLISQGDLVLINPGEKYYWQGNMELFMPCTPAWTPEQHKNIE